MKLKKILGIGVLVIIICFGTFSLVKKSIVNLSVKDPIENLLTKFFEMEMSSDEEDCSNLVLDSKLAKVYNLKFKNLRESNSHKENKSLEINIENIDEIENNKFIVDFNVFKEFITEGSSNKSSAEDEYIAEIIKKDNKFYINKLVDYFDYVQTLDSNSPVRIKKNMLKDILLNDSKYDSIIDNQKSSLENYDKNKEEINK